MLDDVKIMIQAATGYEVPDSDEELLVYLWNSTETEIKADLNTEQVPSELIPVWDRRTAAAYLNIRRTDVIGSANLNVARRITEGKVTVELAGDTPEARYNSLIAAWQEDRGLLSCFRRIRW